MIGGNEVLQLAWTQFWQVSVLILSVVVVSRWLRDRRPHLMVALWLVVLLKCITPPLWNAPSGVFTWIQPSRPVVEPIHSLGQRLIVNSNLDTQIAMDPPAIAESSALVFPFRATESEMAAPGQPENESRSTLTRALTWPRTLLALWVGGALATLFYAFGRLLICYRRIRTMPSADTSHVQRITDQLRIRIGIKHRVTVIVSEARIGPAVFGLWRPVILLPAPIVRGQSPEGLAPIIAHELMHIRRGDVWLGSLQMIVQSIWWFHPLVWIANRMITAEVERCCDDEVLMRSEICAAAYARSLVEVLRQKQHLKTVPAFPGVRPFQITSRRLERIMRIGQGCRKRTSLPCWLTMLAAAAVILPGAAAQQTRETPRTASVKPQDGQNLVTKEYQVGDLLKKLKPSGPESDEVRSQFEDALCAQASCHFGPVYAQPGPASKVKKAMEKPHPTLHWKNGDTIVVSQTTEAHQRIRESLDIARQFGFGQVQVNIALIECSKETIDQLAVQWKVVGHRQQNERLTNPLSDQTESSATTSVDQIFFPKTASMGWDQVQQICSILGSETDVHLLSAPSLLMPYGVEGHMSCGERQQFVVGYDSGEPVKNWVFTGMEIGVRLKPVDPNLWHLIYSLGLSDISEVNEYDFTGQDSSGDETNAKVSVPVVEKRRMTSVVEVTRGQILAVAGCPIPGEAGKQLLAFVQPIDAKNENANQRSLNRLLTDALVGSAQAQPVAAPPSVRERHFYVGKLVAPVVRIAPPPTFQQASPEPEVLEAGFRRRLNQLSTSIKQEIDPNSWKEKGGTGRIYLAPKTLSLVVYQTEENLQQIEHLIEEWEFQHSFAVQIETRAIQIPSQVVSDVLAGSSDSAQRQLTAEQATELLNAVKSRRGAKLIQAPTVTLLNRQSCTLNVSSYLFPANSAAPDSIFLWSEALGGDKARVKWAVANGNNIKAAPRQTTNISSGHSILVKVDSAGVAQTERGVPVEGKNKVFKNVDAEQRLFLLITPKVSYDQELQERLSNRHFTVPVPLRLPPTLRR